VLLLSELILGSQLFWDVKVLTRHLAIYAPAAGLALPDHAFGKDVANLGLYRAMAESGKFDIISFLTAEHLSAEQVQLSLLPNGGRTKLQVSQILDFCSVSNSGILLRGQPYIAELAWLRSTFRRNNSYSIVGLIHTLAPPIVREQIGAVSIAPVKPWDALICTSPSVFTAMQNMFDQWETYLQSRFGVINITRPKFPVIPLGVDVVSQQNAGANLKARRILRDRLQVSEFDVLILWVGRLSYYEKAFPQSMFIALQKAAEISEIPLQFAMVGWFPGADDLELYREAAYKYCPNVIVHFLDGSKADIVNESWAAADIFISLVDNPQETFGLSPVEAMAAGLPVVVSNWDGYSSTVRHGLDGFLVPTLGGISGGIGDELAARHGVGLMSYQDYMGAVAQHTAVDIDAAAYALTKLVMNPVLRRCMGQSGQQNVIERFSWSVITKQYTALFSELSELRALATEQPPSQINPLRGNPFVDFSGFATSNMCEELSFFLTQDLSNCFLALDNLVKLDIFYKECHADTDDLKLLLTDIANYRSCTLKVLLDRHPANRHQSLAMGVSWLAKLGLVNWIR